MQPTIRSATLNRRTFLTASAAVAAAGCSANKNPWLFFTQDEAQTLAAICDQIIPTDEDPGAAWAGVVTYIDRQLTRHFKEHQKTYREGLAATERLAGGDFFNLAQEKQLAQLQKMEKAKDTGPFFSLVVAHTMQGYYGSPRHGGNRDYTSWRMLGVPASPARGRS